MESIKNIIECTIDLLNETSKINVYTNINRFYRIDKHVKKIIRKDNLIFLQKRLQS